MNGPIEMIKDPELILKESCKDPTRHLLVSGCG